MMKHTGILVLLVVFLSCNNEQEEKITDQPVSRPRFPQSAPIDSVSFYKTFILGRWYIPGDPNVALEIGPDEINFGEGLLRSPYQFEDLHHLILTSTDGSADTVGIQVRGDTLFIKNRVEEKEAPYVRRP